MAAMSQKKDDFSQWEDSLIQLHQEIIDEYDAVSCYQKNEHLLYLLREILEMKNSINYPFQRLKTISVLTSKDKKVRFFTWYLIDDQNRHEHYGYLQMYNPKKERYFVYPLIDKWTKASKPTLLTFTPDKWYGAVYYQMIEVEGGGKTFYTLLGWNGGDVFTQQKIIEIFSLSAAGSPVFGSPVFKNYGKTRNMRIIFSYSKTVNLPLHYEKQSYLKKTDKRDRKTNKYIYDTIVENMIVFNQLIPMDESLETFPQFMVPEASLNDAFCQQQGKWVYKQNVFAVINNVLPPAKPYKPKKRIFYQH
jgi:hypothetical protein